MDATAPDAAGGDATATPPPTALVGAADLRRLAIRILGGVGATRGDAEVVADHLVEASLVGVDSHGIVQLPGYVEAIRNGHIDLAARPSVDQDSPAHARVRGHWGFGHVTASVATDLGIAKALEHGCAAVAIVECGHVGRVGHYAEQAAGAGVAALMFAGGSPSSPPVAAPLGSPDRVLSSNPVAFAFPDPGPAFDFATTLVSGRRVTESVRLGGRLGLEALVRPDGTPTDDGRAFAAGAALVPFGGHKGYSIMLQAEWLGRILTGADQYPREGPPEPPRRHQQGILGVFLRADLFASEPDVRRRSRETAERIRGARPLPGKPAVRLPGDRAQATRARRMMEGIPVDAGTWAQLQALDPGHVAGS